MPAPTGRHPTAGRARRSGRPAWSESRLRALVRDVPDFPKPGVVFKDLTPLLADAQALAERRGRGSPSVGRGWATDVVVGIEARGFVLAAPVAVALGVGFVPVRKPGKLPWQSVSRSYELEYGTDALEVHADAVAARAAGAGGRRRPGDGWDGGRRPASSSRRSAPTVAGVTVLIELAFLGGRSRLGVHPLSSLLVYS